MGSTAKYSSPISAHLLTIARAQLATPPNDFRARVMALLSLPLLFPHRCPARSRPFLHRLVPTVSAGCIPCYLLQHRAGLSSPGRCRPPADVEALSFTSLKSLFPACSPIFLLAMTLPFLFFMFQRPPSKKPSLNLFPYYPHAPALS